jgi:hypothetical protein
VSFSDTPEALATELARDLQQYPSVLATTIVPAEESPRGRVEVELTVEQTARDTIPNAVTHAIVRSSMGIGPSDPHNNPDYRRVVVR